MKQAQDKRYKCPLGQTNSAVFFYFVLYVFCIYGYVVIALCVSDCHCLPPSACLLTPDLCSHAPACSDCSQLRHPSAWTAPHQLSSRSVPSLPLRSFVSEDNDIEIAEGNFLSKPEADDILMSHNMNGITKRSYGSPYADRSVLNDDVTLKELYSTLQAIVHDYRGRSTAKRGYSRQISSADVNRLSEQQNGWKTYDGMFTRLPSAYKRRFTWLPDDTLHFANKRAMLSVESKMHS